MNLKADFARCDHTGPGGLRCPCCTHTRGRKGRKKRGMTRYVHRKRRAEGKKACEED